MSTWIALAKSGKLEMGDQVIGHTSTKQPIMAGRAAEHPGYSHWTTADHASAANVHATRAKNLNIAAARSGGSMTLKRDAAASLHAATTHRQASLGQTTRLAASMAARRHDMDSVDLYWQALAKAGGAGSRGGSVIGRTKSGKPVYANHSASHYKGFSEADHKDAASLHAKAHFDAVTGYKGKKDASAGNWHHEAMNSHRKAFNAPQMTYHED